MIWELLATIFAGLGAAGLVMAFRAVFKKLPKWLIPAGAGLGMLFFRYITNIRGIRTQNLNYPQAPSS